MRKNLIFSNYNSDDYREGAIENLMENCGYVSEEEIPESEIWNEIWFMQNDDWALESGEIDQYLAGKSLLVCGSVGLWDGRFAAGKIVSGGKLWDCLKDCDYMEIWDEGGHLHIKGSHHDGTNCFEVKVLTEKGEELWNKWCYDECPRWNNLSEREVHRKLWENSKYSHVPHFAKNVYGCSER